VAISSEYKVTAHLLGEVVVALESQRLYFRSNVHLTPAGHAMVATEVAEEIAKDSAAAAVSPGNEMNDRNQIK
jgi:hypothetical protein